MNIKKDLRELFRKSLASKRSNGCNYPYINRNWLERKTCIYFYEWSDIYRVPRSFNSISEFETYLDKCGMSLQSFQREMIINYGTVYVTCYKESKELNIKETYVKLTNSMNERERMIKEVTKGQVASTPSNPCGRILRPHEILEPTNRLEEHSDYWFG